MAAQYCHYQGISYLNPNAQEFHPIFPTFSTTTTNIISTHNNYYYQNYYYPNNNFPHLSPLLHFLPPSIQLPHHNNLLHHHVHHLDFMQAGQPQLGLGQSSAAAPSTAQLSPGPSQVWPISPASRRSDGGSGGGAKRGRRSLGKKSGNCSNYERKIGFKCNYNDDWSKGRERIMGNSSSNQKIMLVKPDGMETTAMIRNIPNQYT